MAENLNEIKKKIKSVENLQSVVRTMRTLAAVSITQYEEAVKSLNDYYRVINLGLVNLFRYTELTSPNEKKKDKKIGIIVFGSDMGLVGPFNTKLASIIKETIESKETITWSIGQHIYNRLLDSATTLMEPFQAPQSVANITQLIAKIMEQIIEAIETKKLSFIYVFHNSPTSKTSYTQNIQTLYPLDKNWLKELSEQKWPTSCIPEVLTDKDKTLAAYIKEFFFITLFKACAESLASENASRLQSMQKAEKKIEEHLEYLQKNYNHRRQVSIDEELFDIISGFEALLKKNNEKESL